MQIPMRYVLINSQLWDTRLLFVYFHKQKEFAIKNKNLVTPLSVFEAAQEASRKTVVTSAQLLDVSSRVPDTAWSVFFF